MKAWRRLSTTLALFGLSVLAACGYEYPVPSEGSEGAATGLATGTAAMGADSPGPAAPEPY